MAFFKTNLDCTVDGVRTLTPADYIVKYHPYWDGSNPYFDVDSERILFFKSGYGKSEIQGENG